MRSPLAVRILGRLLPEEYRDAVLGDLEEEGTAGRSSLVALRAMPSALVLRWRGLVEGSTAMAQLFVPRRTARWLAWLGGIALVPSALFVFAGILYEVLGTQGPAETLAKAGVLSPWLVIGGVALSILLNLVPLVRIRRTTEEGTPTIALVVRVGVANLALALFGAALFATILAYAFVENFTPR